MGRMGYGTAMTRDELILKLKMLWLYRNGGIRQWHKDVWKKEGAERMCCNGYMCGCYGADHYSHWEHLWDTRKVKR